MTFSEFYGNTRAVEALRQMVKENRLPQTLLFAGPLGVGKATLARLLAAAMNCSRGPGDPCGQCSNCQRILAADLSKERFQKLFEEREKMPPAKRVENPLIVSTHPDFLIFPPDGPLQMITIEQARRLRSAAAFAPSEGKRRLFLIDHADRANVEAGNSLLKTLEEPSPSLTLILTAESPYDLLPTIRSRAVPFYFGPLSSDEMQRFFDSRAELPEVDRKCLAGWAQGSPGRAVRLNVEEYLERRDSMLTLLRAALGKASFADLIARTESLARKSQERLDVLAESLFGLLQDLLHLHLGSSDGLINEDLRRELQPLAGQVSFEWIEKAALELDELILLRWRNIQKQVALEAYAVGLRRGRPAPA